MDTREKWQRMTHPTCAEDYCVTVNISDLLRDCPDIYRAEVAPHLPTNFKLNESHRDPFDLKPLLTGCAEHGRSRYDQHVLDWLVSGNLPLHLDRFRLEHFQNKIEWKHASLCYEIITGKTAESCLNEYGGK